MQMKFLHSLRLVAAATLALSLSGLAAHASPVVPLSLSITDDGSQVSGAFVYDPGQDSYSGSLTFHNGSTAYTFFGSDFIGGGSGTGSYFWTFINSAGNALNLGYDTTTINQVSASLTQVTLCSTAHPCTYDMISAVYTGQNGPILNFDSGTLNISPYQPATTPEPSSFALLGTGILGAAGAVRRRFRRA